MNIDITDLKEIFGHVKKDWDNPTSRPLMEMKGFMPSFYNRLTRMAINNRAVEPEGLIEVLRPLKKFYTMRAEAGQAALAELKETQKDLAEKITPIFKTIVNEDYERLRDESDFRLTAIEKERKRFSEVLNLIDFVLSDPRLQIKDQAFDERGMSM